MDELLILGSSPREVASTALFPSYQRDLSEHLNLEDFLAKLPDVIRQKKAFASPKHDPVMDLFR